jgi:adenine-specific DNA-methyltransferase
MLSKFKKNNKLSYGDESSRNTIINAENLTTLKLLNDTDLKESITCIYIDPPYNNNEKYFHYDDNAGHEAWLKSLLDRISQLFELLKSDGSLWVSIDDTEVHYLKVGIDNLLGRDKFVSSVIWEHRTTRDNRVTFSNNHEYVLVYAKDPKLFFQKRNLSPLTEEVKSRYKNPDNDPRGPWQSVSVNVQDGHAAKTQYYTIKGTSGKEHNPPKGRCWAYNEARMNKEIADGNIWFGLNGDGVPRKKKFLIDGKQGLTPETLWLAEEVGTSKSAKKHILKIFKDEPVFDTPKPEELISKILKIATDEFDLVLDAYLGSGTTAAVAHKMNRSYIGIEEGEHAISHCSERLKQVIDGESGGISKDVNWNGGGGFNFLSPT